MKKDFQFELGKMGKDKITGFEGLIIGRAQHMFGCATYGLAPRIYDKEKMKRCETEWFDEGRIEIIGEGIDPKDVSVEENGCDNRDHPNY